MKELLNNNYTIEDIKNSTLFKNIYRIKCKNFELDLNKDIINIVINEKINIKIIKNNLKKYDENI